MAGNELHRTHQIAQATDAGIPVVSDVQVPVTTQKVVRQGLFGFGRKVVTETAYKIEQQVSGVMVNEETPLRKVIEQKTRQVDALMASGASESDVMFAKVTLLKELQKAVDMSKAPHDPKKLSKDDRVVDIVAEMALALVETGADTTEKPVIALMGQMERPGGGYTYILGAKAEGVSRVVVYTPIVTDTTAEDEVLNPQSTDTLPKNPYIAKNIQGRLRQQLNLVAAQKEAREMKARKLQGQIDVTIPKTKVLGSENSYINYAQPGKIILTKQPEFMGDESTWFTYALKRPEITSITQQ